MSTLTILAIIAVVFVQAFGFRVRPSLDGRIVGGTDADIKDFPHQISLQQYGRHFCGGSILSYTVILTSAHCTINRYYTTLTARAGSDLLGSGGEVGNVKKINQYPNYDAVTNDFDVSVLELDYPLTKGCTVNIQPLDKQVPIGAMATVTGWGKLSTKAKLQKVSVAHFDPKQCNTAYGGKITDRMSCYTSPGKDSCEKDSGGPLVIEDTQVGIVSWGMECASTKYPRVYTRIADKDINNYITQYLPLKVCKLKSDICCF